MSPSPSKLKSAAELKSSSSPSGYDTDRFSTSRVFGPSRSKNVFGDSARRREIWARSPARHSLRKNPAEGASLSSVIDRRRESPLVRQEFRSKKRLSSPDRRRLYRSIFAKIACTAL